MVGQTLSYAYETPGRPDIYPASFFIAVIKYFCLLRAFHFFFMPPVNLLAGKMHLAKDFAIFCDIAHCSTTKYTHNAYDA